ncbi:MAG: NAD(P)H-dependent oxidoreductase subunit E [Proteobacteria bacterium]|nr:NAD(P)H-dependent oxidoreductase subunit E [Pseudomonadota bacterium]
MNPKQESSDAGQAEKRVELLPTLKRIQNEEAVLSEESMAETAEAHGMSVSQVYAAASSYAFLSTRRQGKNVIRICKCVPCHLKQSEVIIDGVKNEIDIAPGQTTEDGKFSLELVDCIGACDQAPAMLINDDLHGNLTRDEIASTLKRY